MKYKTIQASKYELVCGVKPFSQRRDVKPIGRIYINGKYLSVEQSKNYIKAL